jgi:hypothetical protein
MLSVFSVAGFFWLVFDFSVKPHGPLADRTGDGADRLDEA